MPVKHHRLQIETRGKGTLEITADIVRLLEKSGLRDGTATVFCRHTSCSLVIMENADPSARRDLHYFFDKLVPEGDSGFTHTMEGDDDMPSHIKMALTRTSEVIPFASGRLCLGTWQGVFLWEHRTVPHSREVIVTLMGE